MPTAGVVGLFDRDVFIKLACCDLWGAALNVAGVTRPLRLASCTVAGSMRVVGKKLTGAALREATRMRLEAMVAASTVVPEAEHLREAIRELSAASDVDGGEALLFATLEAMGDPSVLLTGDKRFLGALRDAFPERFAAARGRILTFEGCLVRIAEAKGVRYVVQRVLPAAACDNVIGLALGGHGGTDEDAFTAALRSYDSPKV